MNGSECTFCHMCDAEQLKKRRREKKKQLQKDKAAGKLLSFTAGGALAGLPSPQGSEGSVPWTGGMASLAPLGLGPGSAPARGGLPLRPVGGPLLGVAPGTGPMVSAGAGGSTGAQDLASTGGALPSWDGRLHGFSQAQ